MANIFIRGEREPIQVSNERAREIKKLRFGVLSKDGQTIVGKADPKEDLNLGEWAGEIGKITAIKIEHEEQNYTPPEIPLTAQEIENARVNIKKTSEWLKKKGIIN